MIESSEDLITDLAVIFIVAYHQDCYAKELKHGSGLYLSGRPLNGLASDLIFILFIFIAIFSLIFFEVMSIIFFISLIPLAYRFYSYFIYERPLKKFDSQKAL